MKTMNGFVLIAVLAMLAWPGFAPGGGAGTAPPSTAADVPRAGVHYIDADGDGYGPGSPAGPDADDADPDVRASPAGANIEGVRRLLARSGYRPQRIFFVAPDGDNRGGVSNDPARPFASFTHVRRLLRAGDAAVFRAGAYAGRYALPCTNLRGTRERPILIAAYPGERVVFDASADGLTVDRCRHVIFDGFTLTNTRATGAGNGIRMKYSSNVTLRGLEVSKFQRGWIGMQDLHDITAERCVFHDNGGHGVYLGARDRPNSNLTVRNCLMYRNWLHGFQHNGRVKNLRLIDNVIHTNNLAGISLIMGVSDSVVRGNRIFNNNKQGIVFHTYLDRNPNIRPYDQSRNEITGNLIWVGRYSWNGKSQPHTHRAVVFKDSTGSKKLRMDGNVFRDNVIVTQDGEPFYFVPARFALATTLADNLIFRTAGPGKIATVGEDVLDWTAFQALGERVHGNRFADPQFADVSVGYFRTPGRYDFTRKDARPRSSPASRPYR